jgi:cysteine desulfurase/selenocysteine lyase
MPIDVADLDADFYVFSGHKMYGPTGVGVLYGKRDLLEKMPPYQGGGDMIRSVTFEETIFNELPHKFEAGTPHIVGGIGLAVAINYINALGFQNIHDHEAALLEYALEKIKEVEGIELRGQADDLAGILSFTMKAAHPHDIGTILDQDGIAIRTGHHCAQPVMDFMDIPATARASFGLYNTKQDVDRLIDGLHKVNRIFA